MVPTKPESLVSAWVIGFCVGLLLLIPIHLFYGRTPDQKTLDGISNQLKELKNTMLSHEGLMENFKQNMEDYEAVLKEKGIIIHHTVKEAYETAKAGAERAAQYVKEKYDEL